MFRWTLKKYILHLASPGLCPPDGKKEGHSLPCSFLGRGSVPAWWVSQERGKCLGWLQLQEQP